MQGNQAPRWLSGAEAAMVIAVASMLSCFAPGTNELAIVWIAASLLVLSAFVAATLSRHATADFRLAFSFVAGMACRVGSAIVFAVVLTKTAPAMLEAASDKWLAASLASLYLTAIATSVAVGHRRHGQTDMAAANSPAAAATV